MVFLDANPVIYLIEQPINLGPKAAARVSQLLANGERLAVSDLVRMECQVGPLKANDAVLLAQYTTFFASPDLDVLPVSPAVCDRAARIRAQYGFNLWTPCTWPPPSSMGVRSFSPGTRNCRDSPMSLWRSSREPGPRRHRCPGDRPDRPGASPAGR